MKMERNAYRDALVVVDESIEALMYLTEWILEDLDIAVATERDCWTKDDVRSLAALRAIRATLPRFCILRSNYEGARTLSDATLHPPEADMNRFVEQSRAELRRILESNDQTRGTPADELNETRSGKRQDRT